MKNIKEIIRLMIFIIAIGIFSVRLNYAQFASNNPGSGDIGYTTLPVVGVPSPTTTNPI